MRFISTSGGYEASLREAVGSCFAPDGSLYMPQTIPLLPRAYFNNIKEMTLTEIGYVVANSFFSDTLDASVIKTAVESSMTFKIPLVQLSDKSFILELFHGPTLAFKDVGSRFMAAMMAADTRGERPYTVITATTGNTGGAVANAFAGKKNIKVVILFPTGALSRPQQAQFTTLGGNVLPIEVVGSIGKCKQMVREAMSDDNAPRKVICANTHNIIRIIPQIAYFFHAYALLCKSIGQSADGFDIAIPCGNLSNLLSAVMAKRMGLPIGRIIAGCNANDDFVRVLSGELSPDRVNRTSRATLASAMDTGYPTNLWRILSLYDNDIERMRSDIDAYAVTDEEIASTILACRDKFGYLCDPHTAVAMAAASRTKNVKIIAATAHPAKSLDTMTAITGQAVELPLQLTKFLNKPVPPTKMAPSYAALRKFLITNT